MVFTSTQVKLVGESAVLLENCLSTEYLITWEDGIFCLRQNNKTDIERDI